MLLDLFRSDYLCKKGEDIDFFGIVINGTIFASLDYKKIRNF